MKITNVECFILSAPLERPQGSSQHKWNRWDWTVLRLHTNEGIYGTGYMGCLNGKGSFALKALIETEFKPLLIGADTQFSERIYQKLWKHIYYYGQKGLALWALSAVDTALWDLKGKVLKQPLYKLFGPVTDTVPVYGSGLDLWYSDKELLEEVEGFVEKGFKTIKVKVGRPNPQEDFRRMAAVRETIGKNVKLAVDANQGWNVSQAIKYGKLLEEYDIYWLEDPICSFNVEGLASVALALDAPIAVGEMEYTKYTYRDLLVSKAVDVPQIDIMRNGGISECLKIGMLADTWHLPVTSHLYPELSVHILASLPNALVAEYIPVLVNNLNLLITNPLIAKDGYVTISDVPGHGVDFDQKTIDRYRID